MDSRDASPAPDDAPARSTGGGRRIAWHALAMLLAAVLAWFIVAAYRQPDFILDFAEMRLC